MAAGSLNLLTSLLEEWRSGRAVRARATAYVEVLQQDPSLDDVRWLAEHGTAGDADHARWELRYARRALGLLTAQRDALDDRTASAVARALSAALTRDPEVAAGKLGVVERQLNARLTAYGDALANREGAGTGWHLGRTLLRFAGRKEGGAAELVARASEMMAAYMAEANSALRDQFGAASLPEAVPPSRRETP
ncbi:MAG: hypothetical protein M3373_08345 [Gemmatimonadota bacterium]|nr:hypothetical protein [Gemmatimonadota bacterium]